MDVNEEQLRIPYSPIKVAESRFVRNISAHLKIAKEVVGWLIFVQADYTDRPSINLYNKLGAQEEIVHFDIPIDE